MKTQIFILISLFIFSYTCIAQDKELKFVVPDSIPDNVVEFTNQMIIKMPEFRRGEKIYGTYKVSEKSIYRIEINPGNIVKYFNNEKSEEIDYSETNTVVAMSLGTQKIAIGWFRDLVDFGGSAEQPFHNIYIGKSDYYFETNQKNASWGYSSHHFEQSTWKDCYGKYKLTTQKIRLTISELYLGVIYIFGRDFSNLQTNYNGYVFENTQVPVDNNAEVYEVYFRIDFEPSSFIGPEIICSNKQATFTLLNNSIHIDSIVWTKSNNLIYISGQGTENYTVKAPSVNGLASINATLTTDCGLVPLDTKNIWIGKPETPIISAPVRVGMNSIITASASSNYANNYSWSVSGGTIISGQGTSEISIRSSTSCLYDLTIRLVTSNSCGSTSQATKSIPYDCSGGPNPLIISPNPASQQITIEISNLEEFSNDEFVIKILNQYQIPVYEKKEKANPLTVDVSNLQSGIYYLQILKADKIYSDKLIISK